MDDEEAYKAFCYALRDAHRLTKEDYMKPKEWAMLGILALSLAGLQPVVYAQGGEGGGEMKHLREDRRDLRHDRRDIREDRRDIREDRRDLREDRRELRQDRRSGASPDELAKDQRDIRHDRRDLREDHRDLRHDRQDRRHDRRDMQRDMAGRGHRGR